MGSPMPLCKAQFCKVVEPTKLQLMMLSTLPYVARSVPFFSRPFVRRVPPEVVEPLRGSDFLGLRQSNSWPLGRAAVFCCWNDNPME